MCVELRIRPRGSTPGCRYWASLGLVISTAGQSSNVTSVKLSRSWSKANILYLNQGRTLCHCIFIRARAQRYVFLIYQLLFLYLLTVSYIYIMQHSLERGPRSLWTYLRLAIQSPSSNSSVPPWCRLCSTGMKPPSVCRCPHKYTTAVL